jgi:hypothetical protein
MIEFAELAQLRHELGSAFSISPEIEDYILTKVLRPASVSYIDMILRTKINDTLEIIRALQRSQSTSRTTSRLAVSSYFMYCWGQDVMQGAQLRASVTDLPLDFMSSYDFSLGLLGVSGLMVMAEEYYRDYAEELASNVANRMGSDQYLGVGTDVDAYLITTHEARKGAELIANDPTGLSLIKAEVEDKVPDTYIPSWVRQGKVAARDLHLGIYPLTA